MNGIRTHDLCDTGVVLYQLSYQANSTMVNHVFISFSAVQIYDLWYIHLYSNDMLETQPEGKVKEGLISNPSPWTLDQAASFNCSCVVH